MLVKLITVFENSSKVRLILEINSNLHNNQSKIDLIRTSISSLEVFNNLLIEFKEESASQIYLII